MPMTRFKNVAVSSASGETLVDALAGLGERDRTIVALIIAPNASSTGVANDIDVRAYKNQDQVIDYSLNAHLLRDSDNAYEPINVPIRIELNCPLKSGDGFKVGFNGAQGGKIILEYME